MLHNLTRGLTAAAVVCALLAPTLAAAHPIPADATAATSTASIADILAGWLTNAWRSVVTASSTGDDGTLVGEPDDPSLIQSSPEEGGERGPEIDPNG